MIRITAIETGKAVCKAAQVTAKEGRSAIGRKVDIFRDPHFVSPLPIYAFLVEHSEGNFLVDTGDTARNSLPGYLPRWNPFFTKMVKIKVAPVEEIGFQLHEMGINPATDVKAVILTHFHHDHTGGLDHFPHTRIIGSRENWKECQSMRGKMAGYLPQRMPIWFSPDLVDFRGNPVGDFPASIPVTKDGRIFLVPTPGHCTGHMSVVVRDTDITHFLAGDASYNEENIRLEKTDGVTFNPAAALATLKVIKSFAAKEPTIILPCHDPNATTRLAKRQIFA
jgi:N-acyl homoserine lactone hydrolase